MIFKRRPVGRLTPLVALLRQIGGLDLEQGSWVGGGAARCVFEDLDLPEKSDIDFFCADKRQSFDVERRVRDELLHPKESRNNRSGTLNLRGVSRSVYGARDYKVQIVRSGYHPEIAHLFSTFDFTICQFATDGHEIVYTETAEQDLANRVLNIETQYKKLATRGLRMIKYINYGYTPGPGVLSWMLSAQDARNTVTDDLLVSHEY